MAKFVTCSHRPLNINIIIVIYNQDTILPENREKVQSSKRINDADLSKLTVIYDVVFKQLNQLNVKKGSGPDGVPNLFLRSGGIGLREPITHIFSNSLEFGVFPSVWKLSYISPIHKAGIRSEVTNYRPICIQPALSKLFEKPTTYSAFQENHIIETAWLLWWKINSNESLFIY